MHHPAGSPGQEAVKTEAGQVITSSDRADSHIYNTCGRMSTNKKIALIFLRRSCNACGYTSMKQPFASLDLIPRTTLSC